MCVSSQAEHDTQGEEYAVYRPMSNIILWVTNSRRVAWTTLTVASNAGHDSRLGSGTFVHNGCGARLGAGLGSTGALRREYGRMKDTLRVLRRDDKAQDGHPPFAHIRA